MPASTSAVPTALPPLAPKRRMNRSGHGAYLTAAFEALESFPSLVGSRDQLVSCLADHRVSGGDVVAAVEADVALSIMVLRLANQKPGRKPGGVDSIVEAIRLLSTDSLRFLASRAPTFDFFDRTSIWAPESFRTHALAARHAAEAIAAETGYGHPDRLMVTALLHDIGKLVLLHAYPGYPEKIHADARTPEERLLAERRALGVDHALVGGLLARRWGLPKSVATAIERHHADDLAGEAPYVRLADMLAHQAQGGPVVPAELLRVAGVVGIAPARLRRLMCDLPYIQSARRQGIDPCPLTRAELEIVSLLAEGKTYKQIAHEQDRSVSTIRTHLYHTYKKLGTADRAQAVLMASKHGWLPKSPAGAGRVSERSNLHATVDKKKVAKHFKRCRGTARRAPSIEAQWSSARPEPTGLASVRTRR
jgi:putative nucleotidyltransferase with HDIG domain